MRTATETWQARPMLPDHPAGAWVVLDGGGEVVADYLRGDRARLLAQAGELAEVCREVVAELGELDHGPACTCLICLVRQTFAHELERLA